MKIGENDFPRFTVLTGNYGSGKTDTPTGWNDPENWKYLDEIPEDKYFGFAIGNDSHYLFIDFDHCRDAKTGKLIPWAKEIFRRITRYAETYSEDSKSMTGFHMICDLGNMADNYTSESNGFNQIIVQMDPNEYGALPKSERDQVPKVELFYHTAGRYVYLTGRHRKLIQVARDEDAAAIFNELLTIRDEHHKQYAKTELPDGEVKFSVDAETRQQINEALPYIPAADYAIWIRVGEALRNCGFDFEIWDAWSRFADQRNGVMYDAYDQSETQMKWKSFANTKSHWNAGTIFILAKQNGYQMIRRRAAAENDGQAVKEDAPKVEIPIVSLVTVQSKDVEWMIPYFIPKNHLTIIGGDGGSGKSSITANIAACESAGRTSLFEEGYSGMLTKGAGKKVLLLNAEDPLSEVLKPRLERNAANMENIVSVSLENEFFRQIKLGSHALEALVDQVRPDLLVLDPLQSFLEDTVIMGARNQMRNAVGHVVSLCSKYKFTTIIVVHANKGKGLYGRKRLADSGDIWDIARSVFLCGNVDQDTFYISHEKSNYCQRNKSILYGLDKGRIRIQGYTDKHDREFVLNEEFGGKGAPALEEAKDFILDQLMGRDSEMPVKELDEAADAMSISKGTLSRAKRELKDEGEIRITNTGFGGSKAWKISLSRSGTEI